MRCADTHTRAITDLIDLIENVDDAKRPVNVPEPCIWTEQIIPAVSVKIEVLGIGPARLRFDSRTVLYRPERIEVTSSQPPFRYYSLTWLFVQGPAASCSLSVLCDLELQSNLLQHVVRPLLSASIAGAIAAFEARANSLYVRRGG